jgi:hypothetical protein
MKPKYKVGQKFQEFDEWGILLDEYEILCVSPKKERNRGWLYLVETTNKYKDIYDVHQNLLSEFSLSLCKLV